jgi:hypothetical protein
LTLSQSRKPRDLRIVFKRLSISVRKRTGIVLTRQLHAHRSREHRIGLRLTKDQDGQTLGTERNKGFSGELAGTARRFLGRRHHVTGSDGSSPALIAALIMPCSASSARTRNETS